MKYPPLDFARAQGLTLSVSAGGKNFFWSMTEEQFFILMESVAESAKIFAERRRMRVVEVPAFAEEVQAPCDV